MANFAKLGRSRLKSATEGTVAGRAEAQAAEFDEIIRHTPTENDIELLLFFGRQSAVAIAVEEVEDQSHHQPIQKPPPVGPPEFRHQITASQKAKHGNQRQDIHDTLH